MGGALAYGITQRQLLQRREPPFGFASHLRRETRLQRWTHRNALAPLRVFQKSNMSPIVAI
ncbi:hypothetical protein [Nostoc sp.]|uniref:hypothetical protein n=1 Tax=Nostoc sp. TaxID=1180 RepID=UPI002FFA5993